MSDESQIPAPVPSTDTNNIVLLIWLGTLFFGFIPPLIVFLVKKDDARIVDQSKEALNWAITAMIGYAISWILTFILIGFLFVVAIWIVHAVFCILGAINASKGVIGYRLPFALRLIK